MTLAIRIEKLKFLLDEMKIAFHLTKLMSDDPTARMIARHVVIRAENFIAHARQLKKPLNTAGFKTGVFHKTKEAYADSFEEYFKDARHKLGAHIQDFDFGKRIELWNDIESIKIHYFVEGAQEIYKIVNDLVGGGSSLVGGGSSLAIMHFFKLFASLPYAQVW